MSRTTLAAPIAGWLIGLRDVPDPVFSEEMMGVGFAIDPTDGTLVAPCDAQVLLVAPTKHSVSLRTRDGAELLIHLGLETVALQGRGFKAHVSDGDQVKAGEGLLSFDFDLVGLEAKSLVTPILLTNPEDFELKLEPVDRLIERGQALAWIERKAGPKLAHADGALHSGEAVLGFEHGLHARPAARIADIAKRFSSDITIAVGGKSASARSPIAIMALNARKGDRIVIGAVGDDGAEAIQSIVDLLEKGEIAPPRIAAAPTRRSLKDNEIGGVCALGGIAVGTAIRWRRQARPIAEDGRGVERERDALQRARALVRARLKATGDALAGPAAAIARAHASLLDDEQLNSVALAEIERGRSAPRAWQLASAASADALRQADNPLLHERIADLDDIAAQISAAATGEDTATRIEFADDTILIADELLPSEIMSLPSDQIRGLATSGGGATSHMAIIAASLGIPTLVAMGPALLRVKEGSRVLLDASSGVLVIDPDQDAQERALERTSQSLEGSGECVTRDGDRITLLANLGGLKDVEAALSAGAEGCGLLRTEFLFLDRSTAPVEEEQRSAYQAIADALGGRPLTIRTLDIGGDKPVPYMHFPVEQNPALGARGIRIELVEPGLLDEQLRAIVNVKGEKIKVMLPMISSVGELKAVRKRLLALGKNITLGVMVETPAAALIADQLAAEADFLSIGSNDLAQYALAMDRTNPALAASIDALHPAVLSLIAMTAKSGRAAGKSVSVCGNLASDPLGALVLIGLGINELSAVPAALPSLRHAIGQVSSSDCTTLANRSLALESAGEVRALASELLHSPTSGDVK
jgi:phosphocarrier protein FPr/phosphocarrier protein